MYWRPRIGSFISGLLPLLLAMCLLTVSAAAQSNDPAPPALTLAPANAAPDEAAKVLAVQMQILAELQAQQQAALKELQQARKEIAASLAEISSNNAAQLAAVSEMIVVQRKQDLKAVRDSHRIGLAIVVGMSGLMVLSILILNLTSLRAINRMTTMLSASALLPDSDLQALAEARAAQKRQLMLFPGEQGPQPLDQALRQLQGRIQSLEHLAGQGRAETPAADAGLSGAKPSGAH